MDPVYGKTVLDSGIRVVSEKMPHVRSVSLGMWITRGSRDETADQAGISHLIEHMAFKGTPSRSPRDIAIALEAVGGHLDAFTSKEETCYHARCLDEHISVATEVIADISLNSLFRPEDLEKEKKVVAEEQKGLEDTPDEFIHDLFLRLIYPDHPLGAPVLGTEESCRNLSCDTVTRFWRDRYTADAIVVAAAGNVDHDRLVALVEGRFHFPPSSNPPPAFRLPPEEPSVARHPRDISQLHAVLGCRTVPYTHPDRYALLVLNTVLGGGMSSRLFQAVREESGLAYSVYSYADLFRDTGYWAVYLSTSPAQAAEAMRVVLEELRTAETNSLRPDEVTHAKQHLKGSLMLGLESTSNRMMRLARLETHFQRYATLDETVAEIEAVSEDDIHRVARELLQASRLSLVLLGPPGGDLLTLLPRETR
jgi:predicted Zn-dependent peptidase